MATPVELVLERLEEKGCSPRREGAGWSARCPAHDDRKPSLSVGAGDKERALLRCQAGCDFSDVVAALGLEPRELFSSVNGSAKTIVATYSYVDEQDRPLFEAVRYWPKDFRQRRPDGAGGWTWKLGDVRRVLYRLPSVLEAAERGDTVYVVEGERDVHALEKHGHIATCNPMGAGKWRNEYSESLRGADVVVVADRDEPGRAHARAVAGSLHDAAKSVAVVEPTRGDDVAEHLGAGGTLDELVAPTAEPEPKPEPVNGDTFPLLTIADLAALPKPSWLIDELLPVGGFSVLYGPSGVGKSFLALDWALCVAHELEWFGRAVKGGPVVYIVAEGVSGLYPRIEAWSTERRQPISTRVRFIPLAVNMLDRTQVERASRTLALLPAAPTLLIVDTLARSMVGGDENSTKDVGLLIDSVDRLRGEHGAAGLVVHHTGRDGDLERGSTALRGAADMMHSLKEYDAGLRLACEKPKDSAG